MPLASASFYHSFFWEWTSSVLVYLFFVLPVQAESIESHNNLRIWTLDYWLNAASEQVISLCVSYFLWYLYFVIPPSLLTSNPDSNQIYEVCINYVKAPSVHSCVCVFVWKRKAVHRLSCLLFLGVYECVRVCMCDYMHVLSNGLCASSLADGQDVSMATPGRS